MSLGSIVKNFGNAISGKQSSTEKLDGTGYQSVKRTYREVGYTATTGDGSIIPDEYLVTFYSENMDVFVTGAMQDKLDFSVTSSWSPIVPSAPSPVAAAVQLITSRSLVSTFTSRRIWDGTTPIGMSFNLVFESIDDTYLNVVAPTIALMTMALPSKDQSKGALKLLADFAEKTGVGDVGFFLVPPGPDPFFQGRGDHLSVSIGTHFQFDNIIIHSVRPAWDFSRVDVSGWPMRSEVSIEIQTYEIMTRDRLQGAIT